MEKEIPKIDFNKEQILDIEVMDFPQLINKLEQSKKTHNPFAIHKIQFYCILVITNGTYTHFVDFKSYKLVKGSAIFIAKNQVHYFTNELSNAEGFCIVFNSSFVDKHHFLSGNHKFNRLFNYHIETPVIHQEQMGRDSFIRVSKKLLFEYNFPDKFVKIEMLKTLLHVLLLKAERAKELQSMSIIGIKNQWLETFIEFKSILEKNYVETRSSRDYASKLFISYKFLNDIVKKLTGKTVKAFIDGFVIIEIKRYLVSTSLSIKEISYKTGFEEPANMVKFFKKNTNTTPLKFRQQF